jgi:exo-beta-1,3-glucanase (GH17 family)
MRPRFRRPTLLVTALFAVFAGCGTTPDAGLRLREDPFTVRTFEPNSGDRWIGNAICYGPHRDGQRPGGPSPSAAEIRQDLHLLVQHWNLLRIYGSSGSAETILTVIHDDGLDMKVMLGAWIAPDAATANDREVDAAIRLANAYPDIVIAVSVGNETQVSWSAHRSPPEVVVAYVRQVRAEVAVPVTTADDFSYWNEPESRALAGEIDFITMHAHPMWNGLQLADALEWLRNRTAAVGAVHPDRAVVIGETGWATSVHDHGEQTELIKGRPGEREQQRFYAAVRKWAGSTRQTVFFFEAFDENWKGGPHPAEVEKHWGLYRADRSPKSAMTSISRP